MNNNLDNIFFQKIKNKSVAFAGISRSNLPLINIFLSKGISTTVCDANTSDEIQAIANDLKQKGAVVILGKDYLSGLSVDILFRTPGINFFDPELIKLRERGVVVTSEMEVFFELCPCKIIAVTGSDGKTTTVTLITKMLEHAGKRVHLGGNIGNPLLQNINQIKPNDVAVVELSSFQLVSMRKSPDVALVTNLSPNHLDVHKDMNEYIDAKKNIILHQNAFSSAVLNFDNSITESMSSLVRGKKIYFSMKDMSKEPAFNGVYLKDNGVICVSQNGITTQIMHKDLICIPGSHNIENYLAAIAVVYPDVSIKNIQHVAKSFAGVPHRAEFVTEISGVKYYNDSIASSPTRTIKGTLSLYNSKIILICGGYDKKISFEQLGREIVHNVKILILMGQTANLIEKAVLDADHQKIVKIIHVDDMVSAINFAKENAVPGDVVSLSPACASFDMYKNFEERGNHFKEILKGMS